MTREEFALFLKGLKDVQENGGDVDAYIKRYKRFILTVRRSLSLRWASS